MKKLHVISIAGVVVLAAACISISAPESASAQSVSWRSEAAALLPPDATGLMGFDLDTARSSSIYRYFEEHIRDSQRAKLDQFASLTGFDPRRDLSGILAATWGGPGRGKQPFLAVLRGRFDLTNDGRAMLDTFAPQAGQHRGITIYELKDKDDEQHEAKAYFAFLDGKSALIGMHDAVVAGIERSVNGGPSIQDNAALLARADQAAGSGQLWFVSNQPQQLIDAAPSGMDERHARLFTILRSMQQTTFTANLINGLSLNWKALLGSADDAKTLADAARGMLALARISVPPEHQELLNLLDHLEIDSNVDRIDVGANLTTAEVDQLLKAIDAKRESSGQTL